MKVVINTAHQRFGGAIQVALSFIHECINFPENEYYVWVGQGVGKSLDVRLFPDNFYFYFFDFGPIKVPTIQKIQKTLRTLEVQISPDVLIATSGPSYYNSIAPQIIGFNLPLYIYPESPFLKNMSLKSKVKLEIKKKLHIYYFKRDANAYVVQNEDVNRRVKKFLKVEDVFTVTNNHNNFFLDSNLIHTPKLPSRVEDEFRFLSLTSYYPHKNLELLNEIVFNLSKEGLSNIKFVLTLNESDFKQYFVKSPNIINVGPISPQECPALYKECDAMFLPTLAECFSASFPEAMIMEKPIVTTDLGFSRNICGSAALYFEPMNAQSAIKQIIKLYNDKKLQKQLVEAGLIELKKFDSPQMRAKKYLEICKNLSNQVQSS